MMAHSHHRLPQATWTPTLNCQPRAQGCLPELIVLHSISLPAGEYGSGAPARLFLNELDITEHPSFRDLENVRVSPHLFIDRSGHIQQFVDFDHQAWHAGLSSWRHRSGCNSYSIGIELEGTDSCTFTKAQYLALSIACRVLLDSYPSIGLDAIVGHMEIAPKRKSDPGVGFDWPLLYRALCSNASTLNSAE